MSAAIVGALLIALVAATGCGSFSKADTGGDSTSTAASLAAQQQAATAPDASGLRAATRAYAQAWLTGSASQIETLRASAPCGPDGAPLSASPPTLSGATLSGLRSQITKMLGRPLDQVHITSVETRNVTATRGEARPVYDVPGSAAGNDNWLELTYEDGRWQVTDCKLPIGGDSAQASGVATPAH